METFLIRLQINLYKTKYNTQYSIHISNKSFSKNIPVYHIIPKEIFLYSDRLFYRIVIISIEQK